MELIRKPLAEITFESVEQLCVDKYPEGVQLDYKRELPKDLPKLIAAFANTRGGLIIMGVEEDKTTGLPPKWEGVKNDGKLLERVDQLIANVSPLPSYEARFTNDKSGKAFLLVRVEEGYATPYYPLNDANIWVRTGSIRKSVDIASPEATELLFGKKHRAGLARENNFKMMQQVFDAKMRGLKKDMKAKAASGDENVFKGNIEDVTSELEVVIQPYYPAKALISPSELRNKLRELRFNDFPDLNIDPIPNGVAFARMGMGGAYECHQVFSNGLMSNICDVQIARGDKPPSVYMGHIAGHLFTSLKLANRLFDHVNYQGVVTGHIKLSRVEGLLIFPTGIQHMWLHDEERFLLNDYFWDFEIDTHLLNNPLALQNFFIDQIKNMEWDTGWELGDNGIRKLLEESRWLVKEGSGEEA